MIIFGIIGVLFGAVALWLTNEVRQNTLFILAGIALLIYSIHIEDPVFIVLQIIFMGSAALELLKKR